MPSNNIQKNIIKLFKQKKLKYKGFSQKSYRNKNKERKNKCIDHLNSYKPYSLRKKESNKSRYKR